MRSATFRFTLVRRMKPVLSTLVLLLATVPARSQPPPWMAMSFPDGWPVSSPEEQGLDSAVVERLVEIAATDPRLDTIHSLLLVRHGTLVAEAYFGGRRPEQSGEIRSATKSFTSLLVGIALDRGWIDSVDQPLFELLPAAADLLSDPAKRRLTLRHALTMRLGLAWEENSPGYTWDEWPPDLVRFTLEQPVREEPGTRFRYSSGTTQLLAATVIQAAGRDLHTFARENLFDPLDIEGTSWMRHFGGRHYGGVGLFIRPRDMAKIGQLALQRGLWETEPGEIRRVISEAWIRESTRNQMDEDLPYFLGGYGYQWWVSPDDGSFAAIGHGGQWIAVIPEKDAVLVVTAEPRVGPDDSIDVSPLTVLFEDIPLEEAPGRVTFPAERFSAVEGQGSASVPVRRFGGSDGAAKVVYTVTGGTARPAEDFRPVTGVLSWSDGDASPRRFDIPLVDDLETEGEESFEVRLEVLTGGVTLGRRTATVLLRDDDPPSVVHPGRLGFAQDMVPAREGESARLEVERRDGGDGEVSVRWSPLARSADAGTDFPAAGGVLHWADGDREAKTIEIPLADDGAAEPTELLGVRLSEPAGGATLDPDGTAATVAILDAASLGECLPGPTHLCLNGNRFRVEVEWRDPRTGGSGRGHALAGDGDTGMLWFFDADNAELIVKVLDGRPVNGAHWVFYGGLSDVEYWLTVLDTATGAARGYHNRPFHLCGDADTRAFPAAVDALPGPTALPVGSPFSDAVPAASGACVPGTETLCLFDGRFEVDVAWHDLRSGNCGSGRALPGNDATGTFWFFRPDNVELVVKLLDGRPVNGKLWFFYGALSDVDYRITVTDTLSGAVREYHNPFGSLCGGADTSAFEP